MNKTDKDTIWGCLLLGPLYLVGYLLFVLTVIFLAVKIIKWAWA